jgi:hypothetical protein
MKNVLERKGILTGKEVLDKLEVIATTKGREVNSISVSRVIRGLVFYALKPTGIGKTFIFFVSRLLRLGPHWPHGMGPKGHSRG